jgi:hypothetical protein
MKDKVMDLAQVPNPLGQQEITSSMSESSVQTGATAKEEIKKKKRKNKKIKKQNK